MSLSVSLAATQLLCFTIFTNDQVINFKQQYSHLTALCHHIIGPFYFVSLFVSVSVIRFVLGIYYAKQITHCQNNESRPTSKGKTCKLN